MFYYNKPSYKKENMNGFEEGYNFKEVSSVKLTTETNIGGYGTWEPSKENRLLIVKKGTGSMKVQGKTHYLGENEIIEIPQGSLVDFSHSQFIVHILKTENSNEIKLEENKNEGGFKQTTAAKEDRIIFIKNGVGFARIGNKTLRIDESSVIEIPQGETLELSGNFEYYTASAN